MCQKLLGQFRNDQTKASIAILSIGHPIHSIRKISDGTFSKMIFKMRLL